MSHLIYYCIILKIPFYFVWWNDLITVYKHYKLTMTLSCPNYILHGKSIISVKIHGKPGQCVLCSLLFKLIWELVLQMKNWQMTFSVCIIFFSLCLTFLLHPFIIGGQKCPNLNCMNFMHCFKIKITFLFPLFNHDSLLKNLLAFIDRRNRSFSMKRWSLSVCYFY